jgi:hypothetical protein
MPKMLLVLLFAARVVDAGTSGPPCPTMSPSQNVSFSYTGSVSGCWPPAPTCIAGEDIQFRTSTLGYNFACAPHQIHLDFGDGAVTDTADPSAVQTHTYLSPATYTVTVTIANPNQVVTMSRDITVIDPNAPPFTAEGWFDFGVRVPRGYRFVIGSALGFGDWIWDFGDGTIVRGAERQQNHIYTRGGTFSVRLSSELPGKTYSLEVQVPVDRRRSVRH